MTPRLVALAILDAAVLAACLLGLPVGWALLVHAALTVGGLAIWLRGGGEGFAPAIFGLLGPLPILLAVPIDRAFRQRRPVAFELPFEAAGQAARTGADLKVARMLDGRVLHADAETLYSLVTIMRHGDVATRRQALETVVRSFQPALSPLIALALTDPDQTIRALAAAAAARVGQNLTLARTALEGHAIDDPAASATLAALLADHARGDVLLSDSQRAHLRDDAVTILRATPGGADETTMLEALWAAGDYAAMDRLAGSMTGGTHPVATWWRTESLA